MGLDSWTIPGGEYARGKVAGWEANLGLIGQAFEDMAAKYERDSTRPSVEFYRAQRELICLLPIR